VSKITLLHIDCMEYMATLPDKAFELAIVDPPYGIGEDGSKDKSRIRATAEWRNPICKGYKAGGWDNATPTNEYFTELQRVSCNQIIWGANHMADLIAKRSPCWVVWDKDNSGDFADCELAYTSFKTAVRKFRYRWNGMIQENMANKEIRIHPTQKPAALYEWLLTNYAKPGDRILDTHLGSGSSAIAAHYGGFEFVGCELDEDYYKAAVQRFESATAQLAMFGGEATP